MDQTPVVFSHCLPSYVTALLDSVKAVTTDGTMPHLSTEADS